MRKTASTRRIAIIPSLDALSAPRRLDRARLPLGTVEQPDIYRTLRDDGRNGIVLELPAGTRDSFQTQGALDHRVLAFQTIHRRPIVGGVVSRLSPAVVAAYDEDPLLGPLLRASVSDGAAGAAGLPDRATAAERLAMHGIRFVMLNDETAPPGLRRYVENVLPLTLVIRDGERSLYVVTPGNRD